MVDGGISPLPDMDNEAPSSINIFLCMAKQREGKKIEEVEEK